MAERPDIDMLIEQHVFEHEVGWSYSQRSFTDPILYPTKEAVVAAIREKWPNIRDDEMPESWEAYDRPGRGVLSLEAYSEDKWDSWDVLERMAARGWSVLIGVKGGKKYTVSLQGGDGAPATVTKGTDLPLAICCAALMALGIQVPPEPDKS